MTWHEQLGSFLKQRLPVLMGQEQTPLWNPDLQTWLKHHLGLELMQGMSTFLPQESTDNYRHSDCTLISLRLSQLCRHCCWNIRQIHRSKSTQRLPCLAGRATKILFECSALLRVCNYCQFLPKDMLKGPTILVTLLMSASSRETVAFGIHKEDRAAPQLLEGGSEQTWHRQALPQP